MNMFSSKNEDALDEQIHKTYRFFKHSPGRLAADNIIESIISISLPSED